MVWCGMATLSFEKFTQALYEVTGLTEADMSTPLGDLDIDSLAVVELLYALEEDYDLEIDLDTAERLPTLCFRDIYEFAIGLTAKDSPVTKNGRV